MQDFKRTHRTNIDQNFEYVDFTLFDYEGTFRTEEDIALIRDFLRTKFNYQDVVIEQEGFEGDYVLDVQIGYNDKEPFYVYNAEVDEGCPASWYDPGWDSDIYCYDHIDELIDDIIGKDWPFNLEYELQDWQFDRKKDLYQRMWDDDVNAYEHYLDSLYDRY